MKLLYKISLLFVASVLFLDTTGQPPVRQARPNKPLLFSQVKNQVEVPVAVIEQFFLSNVNDSFSVQFGEIEISGVVTDKKILGSDSSISINLRLVNFKNALFNIVSIKNNDSIPVIRGRIVHPKFGDVLILEPENGKYYLRKQEQRLLLTE